MGYVLWSGTQLESENEYTGAPYKIKTESMFTYSYYRQSPRLDQIEIR